MDVNEEIWPRLVTQCETLWYLTGQTIDSVKKLVQEVEAAAGGELQTVGCLSFRLWIDDNDMTLTRHTAKAISL